MKTNLLTVCAAVAYRHAFEVARDGGSPDAVQNFLAQARAYDSMARDYFYNR